MKELDKILDGQITGDELEAFKAKLSEDGKKSLSEALAFRAKKKDDEAHAAEAEAKLQKLKDDIAAEEARVESLKGSSNQFRDEQVSKAKEKFFKDYEIKPEEQSSYDELFKKIDSGKVDPDLIYKDFEVVYGAKNSSELIEAKKKQIQMQKDAALSDAAAAGANKGGSQGGEGKKEYSEATKALSQKAGISLEDAERQINHGMHRILG